MSLQDGRGRLIHAIRTLRLRWDATREDWDDAASRDFARLRLDPIVPKVASTLQAVERLAEVLNKAHEECKSP
ncbi:MAG: hypothetical protein K1X74_18475 [Pirellulales bacterium]|nr:hypothetical protein [Pirellulales bacterium]